MSAYCRQTEACAALGQVIAFVLLIIAGPIAYGASAPSFATDTVARLITSIKAGDATAARQCYAEMPPNVAERMGVFIDERMALHTLIASIEKQFPDQSANLQKSKLAPFTDQAADREIISWRNGTEKVLRDGSILVKSTTGSSKSAMANAQSPQSCDDDGMDYQSRGIHRRHPRGCHL